MDLLHLELDQDATRRHISDQLFAQFGVLERNALHKKIDSLHIEDGDHYHNLAEVEQVLENLNIEDPVLEDARAVYRVLAEAEATAHGCKVEETHFHEVGNSSTLREMVAICLMIDQLHPAEITATRVQTGKGKVQCAHGLLDIPAPATAAIIARGIPTVEEKIEGEWCTPTSAALIYHFVDTYEL